MSDIHLERLHELMKFSRNRESAFQHICWALEHILAIGSVSEQDRLMLEFITKFGAFDPEEYEINLVLSEDDVVEIDDLDDSQSACNKVCDRIIEQKMRPEKAVKEILAYMRRVENIQESAYLIVVIARDNKMLPFNFVYPDEIVDFRAEDYQVMLERCRDEAERIHDILAEKDGKYFNPWDMAAPIWEIILSVNNRRAQVFLLGEVLNFMEGKSDAVEQELMAELEEQIDHSTGKIVRRKLSDLN